jgi:hypothetical protein
MKIVSKIVGIVALVFVGMIILAIIVGVVGNIFGNKTDVAINPEDYRESFMEGCMIDESFKDFCACGFDRLKSENTDEELSALFLDYTGESVSDESKLMVADAAEYCMDKIK